MVNETMIVLAMMVLVSLVILVWKQRFIFLTVALMAGSVYLLLTSDMFLVIRLPTVCVAGMGILFGLWGLSSPILNRNNEKVKNS